MWQQENLYFSVIWKLIVLVSRSGLGEKDQVGRTGCAEGTGSFPDIKPHGDKVLVTRSLFNAFIICTKHPSASPKVTGSKEHEPIDKLLGLRGH